MNDYSVIWSRRNFIRTVTGAGAFTMFNPLMAWAAKDVDPKVSAIVAKTIGIDTHNHIDVPLDKAELPGPKLNLSEEITKSGLSAIVMTFATDYKRNIESGEAYERFLNGLDAMDKVLKDNKMIQSLTLADIQSAHNKHKPTVVQAIEGCHFLEGKIERIEVAYRRGLRHLGLLHDSDASTPLGDVYTNPAKFNGLTDFGKQVIKEANRLGMLIDLTHASNDTINAALKITTVPVIISHTGLNTRVGNNAMMAKMMQPRLISTAQAKIVAESGGVIGVWTHLSDTALDYAQNIRAMADVVGIDHVCMGTDSKLTPSYHSPTEDGNRPSDPPPGQDGEKPLNFPSEQNSRGNSNNGGMDKKKENKPPMHFGEKTNEAWEGQNGGFYYAVVDALLKTGFNEAEIGKIGGGNYCRVFNAATSGK